MSAFAKLARPSYVTITDADISVSKSLHTLLDKYLDYMTVKFEHNRMVRSIQNFELFGNEFWESVAVDPILENVSVT